ncbi:MAG: hypothetical protein E6K94_00615 [Thaumarchaeota archaeon]|nr:MAG: hypothetical protein E6K94_00615 [Nitrososphaerota archaeon]
MKPLYSVLAILTSVTIIGMVTISTQQASAFGFVERQEFKKLTKDFEKDVLDAAIGDPGIIPGLVDKYHDDVIALFRQ